jgi:dTDP-4-amino-4,6-dideoxygalactose transaminase
VPEPDHEVRVSSQLPEPIPFHRPAIGEAEIEAAVEVLRSGWLTTGAKAHALEAAFADRLGVQHALAVNSGTAALHLALDGFGIGSGDEVAIPTYTFTACGEVCAYVGARPALTDVGEDYLLGPAQLEPVLTAATRAVMPVHFAGLEVDTIPLRELAPDARFIEDAAHALPSTTDRAGAGRLGDAAAFSFYATKTITTGGEGGMLTTNDDALAARAALMRLHGISADAWNRYGAGGHWAYEVAEAGFKYNLTDVSAAIGLVQFARLDDLAAQRIAIAARYDERFGDSALLRVPPRHPGAPHAWHLYVIQLELDALTLDRAQVIERLGVAGIGTSVHFIPLHLHPHYQRRYGYKPGDFPAAERLFERSISLPIWPGMTDAQVDRVAATLLEVVEAARHPVQV